MHDTAFSVDEKYAGAKTIQRIGEVRNLGFLVFDRPVDHLGSLDMRSDQRDAPSHLVVHHALAREEGEENRTIRFRLFEYDVRHVDAALGPQPFLIERPAAILVISNEI